MRGASIRRCRRVASTSTPAVTWATVHLLYDPDRGGLVVGNINDPFAPLAAYQGDLLTEVNGVSLVGMSPDELAAYFREHPVVPGDVLRYQGDDGVLGATLLGVDVGAVPDFKQIDVAAKNVSAQNFDAELRVYLRQPGDYRLTDAAGTVLCDWAPFTSDATPLFVATGIPRTADDEYDLYVERRVDDKIRKFQVQFSLASAARRTVTEPVTVAPTVDVPDGPRVRERVRIRIPAGTDPAEVQRALEKAGVGPGAPGSGARAPGSPGSRLAGSGTGPGPRFARLPARERRLQRRPMPNRRRPLARLPLPRASPPRQSGSGSAHAGRIGHASPQCDSGACRWARNARSRRASDGFGDAGRRRWHPRRFGDADHDGDGQDGQDAAQESRVRRRRRKEVEIPGSPEGFQQATGASSRPGTRRVRSDRLGGVCRSCAAPLFPIGLVVLSFCAWACTPLGRLCLE